MRTSWGVATDRGRVRELNEDSVLAKPPVFLVADGMGGYDAGDVASRLVVDAFATLSGRTTVSPAEVHERFHTATRELREAITTDQTAGSTVAGVAVVQQDDASYWLVFNIGDSRVYRWHDEQLQQISVDHSVVQELLDAGVLDDTAAAAHPQRHQVTRALATHVDPEPDYWLIPSDSCRRILICSDGLTIELPDGRIAELLGQHTDAQHAADELVAAAVAAGGRDNISAVVVDVVPTGAVQNPNSTNVDNTAGSVETAQWDEQLEGTTVPRSGDGRNR